jgi:Na+/glutamate symporter
VSLKMPVLLAALVLYLGEILARRIKEMRKL